MSILELLERPLPPVERPEPDGPSEDPGRDGALLRAQSLAAQDQLLPAAEAARRLWDEQIYDVRALGYLLHGAFLSEGPGSLARVIRGLCRCLAEEWERLRPVAQKGKHLGGALRWFVTTLHNHLAFCKFQNDATWQLVTTDGRLVSEILAAFAELSRRVAARPEIPAFAAQQQRIVDLLLPHAASAAAPAPTPAAVPKPVPAPVSKPVPNPAPVPVPAPAPPVPEKKEEGKEAEKAAVVEAEPEFVLTLDQGLLTRESEVVPQLAPILVVPVAALPAPAVVAAAPVAVVSAAPCRVPLRPALRWLLAQAAAIEELLQKRELLRAAILIADLERSLDVMEPESLLPEAMQGFWSAVCAHAESLAPALDWAGSEDPRARLLLRLYRMNPTGFGEPAPRRADTPRDGAVELPSEAPAPLMRVLGALQLVRTQLERGAVERAAVILADLLPRLERFDAREHLAPLLIGCYRGQAELAGELLQLQPQLASLRGQAMRRLHEMDPAAFLAESIATPSTPSGAPSPAPPTPPFGEAELAGRIEVFAELLLRGDSLRAVAVAAEIEGRLERDGTPGSAALRRFYALLLKNAAALESARPLLSTLKGRALRGLCRCEPRALLAL